MVLLMKASQALVVCPEVLEEYLVQGCQEVLGEHPSKASLALVEYPEEQEVHLVLGCLVVLEVHHLQAFQALVAYQVVLEGRP